MITQQIVLLLFCSSLLVANCWIVVPEDEVDYNEGGEEEEENYYNGARRPFVGLFERAHRPEESRMLAVGLRGAQLLRRSSRHLLTQLQQAAAAAAANGTSGRERRASPQVAPLQVQEQPEQFTYLLSPITNQILSLKNRLNGADLVAHLAESYQQQSGATVAQQCRTLRAPVELEKDELDAVSGRLLRSCRGSVALNRCEGSCSSSVQPTVKSRSGLKQNCFCCNEGSLRKIEVRLNECYSPIDNQRISRYGSDLSRSFMDIQLEEPMECECRRCDSLLS